MGHGVASESAVLSTCNGAMASYSDDTAGAADARTVTATPRTPRTMGARVRQRPAVVGPLLCFAANLAEGGPRARREAAAIWARLPPGAPGCAARLSAGVGALSSRCSAFSTRASGESLHAADGGEARRGEAR
eukprot:scaffold978_cov392-Prasinococcus_capsulatus_cf.AAC.26